MIDFRPPGVPPMLFAHRGVSALAPENTLAAFTRVRDQGIAGVELDVHLCASGEIVVCHDGSLQRTAGVNVLISESTLDELKQHDVGSWFDPSFSAERIPTLSEVFSLLGDSVVYDIEIKSDAAKPGRVQPDGIETAVSNLVRDAGLEAQCLVSSFDPFVLRRFQSINDHVPVALIYMSTPDFPATGRHGRGVLFCRPEIMKPHFEGVNARTMSSRRLAKRHVLAWTVDDPAEARRLADAGVDGIISNNPGAIAW